ncbi:unnamed protein product [Paramecium octaurelia]|uniref:Uncharacterized protein n=1 Tax=Paramecium octaurelia TaxID=43137 RepID=A0A8S1WAT4_PAROT|nr:unnamed protein product [Paramecium octaurelia]
MLRKLFPRIQQLGTLKRILKFSKQGQESKIKVQIIFNQFAFRPMQKYKIEKQQQANHQAQQFIQNPLKEQLIRYEYIREMSKISLVIKGK